MALTWTLTLKDAISGAAARATASLNRVTTALHGTQAASNASLGGKVAKGLGGGGGGGRKAGKSFGGTFATAMGGAISGTVSKVASELGEAGSFVFEQLGKVLEGAGMKQGIMLGFSRLLHGTAEAEAAWTRIKGTAQDLGMGQVQAAKAAQSLLARGFQMEGDTGIIKTLAAVQALKALEPNVKTDKVLLALGQIRSKGKLMMEELTGQLGEQMDLGEVLDQIAKIKGLKTRDAVRKAITAGTIDSETAIKAIFASIEAKGGASIEQLAALTKGSLPNMFERLTHLPEDIGANLNIAPFLGKASGAIDQLIKKLTNPQATKFFDAIFNVAGGGVLDKLGGAFDKIADVVMSDEGIRFFSAVADVLGAGIEGFAAGFVDVAKALLSMDPEGMKAAAEAMRAFGYAIGAVVAGLLFLANAGSKIWGGLSSGASAVAGAFNDVLAAGKAVDAWVGGLADWGRLGESMAQGFAAVPVVLATVATGISGFLSEALVSPIVEVINTISEAATALGTAIIDGIVSGISAGASRVYDAISGVATGALASAAGVLGIHSPSKAFEDIYRQTGAGAVQGIEGGAGAVASANENVARGAMNAATGFAAGQRLGGITNSSSDSSKSIVIGDVHVTANGNDPAAIGASVASSLRSMAESHG